MSLFGPPNVEKLKVKRDVHGLIKALHHRDKAVRWAAVRALGEFADSRAIVPLMATFDDQKYLLAGDLPIVAVDFDFLVMNGDPAPFPAAEVLVMIGPASVEPLISYLEWGEAQPFAKAIAARALGNIGDTRAVEPLVNILNSRAAEVADEAAEDYQHLNNLHSLHRRLLAQGRSSEEAKIMVGAMDAMEYSAHIVLPMAASWALGRIGDVAGITPLTEALGDPDERIRLSATEALEKVRDRNEIK